MLGTLLAGCVTTNKGSVAGECRLVSTPQYAVKGRTNYDQNWIDDTTERLVGGCKQARPKARPASLDAKPKAAPLPKPAPKASLWERFKGYRP
jgi:hypothetical protein